MEKYYFTFGSWKRFPFQNTYLVVIASSYRDAIKGFREKYPDVNPECLNCSDYYDEEQWKAIKKHYPHEPADIIWTETCFGKKPCGYDDLFVYVPEMRQIIRIAEGSGDNLLHEDIENGYVDYIYYDQHQLESSMPEVDGGQIMLKELLQDKYRCLADSIPEVLDTAYNCRTLNCTIL